MPGPPPKDEQKRARRNATVAMTMLPRTGRPGRAPSWPLPADVVMATRLKIAQAKVKDLTFEVDDPELSRNERQKVEAELERAIEAATVLDETIKAAKKLESQLWTSLWKTPMAVEWDRLVWTHEVAQYVRWQVRGELGDLRASSEARLRADALGLTPMSMLRLRWRVTEAQERTTGATRSSGSRARYSHLRAVAGGADAGK